MISVFLPWRSFSAYQLALGIIALLSFSACNRGSTSTREVVYVSAPQAILRDHVSTVYAKTGVVKNGDRLEVLGHEKRFVQVRTTGGVEGWIEQRNLITQAVYDGFQKLAKDATNAPVQATGTTRNDTNLHITPGRETDHLFQLNQSSKVELLKRATVEKNSTAPPQAIRDKLPKNKDVPKAVMEDWWLVRDPQKHVGWVLGRMIDLDVPLEIAQYAEGQRLVSFFVLNQVIDKNRDKDNNEEKKVPQYLVMLTEPKDGMPFDYNQIRVFTWNTRRHRYETAYRERNLNGFLPVTVTQENFDKEGVLPVFVLRVKDDEGKEVERKYKLNTPIVKRVLAPGEPPPAQKRRRR